MRLLNLTPHPIVLRGSDGADTTVPPAGTVARVASTPGQPETIDGVPVPVTSPQTWGEVEGLPAPAADTLLIVSALVLGRLAGTRPDCVAPGTGPADGAVRDPAGRIVAVTRLVR